MSQKDVLYCVTTLMMIFILSLECLRRQMGRWKLAFSYVDLHAQ